MNATLGSTRTSLFNIEIAPTDLDDVSALDMLSQKGAELGQMILNNQTDPNAESYACRPEVRACFEAAQPRSALVHNG